MSKTTEPTPPTTPDPTPQPPAPTLEQLFAAWLAEHKAEISIGVRTPLNDATVMVHNFIPPGWTVTYVPVAKAK